MTEEIINRKHDNEIDELEALLLKNFETVDCPLEHLFAPGVYIRSILMEAGMVVTSLIHNTCHPYIVSQGVVTVFVDGKEPIIIKAPFSGITQAGTRRVLRIWETTIWSTVHPMPFITGEENSWSEEEKEKLVKRIEDVIIEKHENKVLSGTIKNNSLIKNIENELREV